MSYINQQRIQFSDTPSIDAFGRLRVSQPATLFDSKQLYDKDTDKIVWDEEINGAGASSSHSTAESAVTMAVANDTEYVIRATKMRFLYQPGKSQFSFFTGVMSTETDVTKRIGLMTSSTTGPYTPNNGIYFENDGTGAYVVINKNETANRIAQANWNLDTMDGNGPSGITVDWDQSQIFTIDYEWLGVGRVRMGLVINGLIHHVHQFLNANISSTVYTPSPNLSVRYEIRSTGGSGSLVHICSTVMSEGGQDPIGVLHTASNGITPINVASGTPEIILGIRLRSTHPDAIIILTVGSGLAIGGINSRVYASFNPTYDGTGLTWNNVGNGSAIEYAVGEGDNNVTDNGLIIGDRYISGSAGGGPVGPSSGSLNSDLANAIRLGVALDGTVDEFYIIANPLTADEDYVASISWRELI